MPHTSRKKAQSQRNKRVQVEHEDGWTTISSTISPRGQIPEVEQYVVPQGPMEPDSGMTLEKLQERYASVEKRWIASTSFKQLEGVLVNETLNPDKPIATCVVFGTGSPSGSATWWIGRTDLALWQLAIFSSIANTIERTCNHRPQCYAQEPFYNTMDAALLNTLNIQKVDDPEGFELLRKSSHTFAYAPAAELNVDINIFESDPDIYLGSKMDYFWRGPYGHPHSNRIVRSHMTEEAILEELQGGELVEERLCRAGEAFLQSHSGVVKLPDLDVHNQPFYQQHLYWRTDPTDQDESL